MRFITRASSPTVLRAAQTFPAVVVTGPRRAGKTTLLRRLFPDASYVLLEDPDVQARVREDPRAVLDDLRLPVIFDEIQNAPELLAYVRTRIDAKPRAKGRWLFTGSQEAPLMKGIPESMAGRAAILQLLPLSASETSKSTVLHGGFPEVLSNPSSRSLWFSSYIQTYLERDVRAVTNVRDLATFRRFLALLASRHGQLVNRTDLAAPLGVSVPTISDWLSIVETTAQIILVPPYFENFGKRLLKTPKLYIADSGLACHLLGIRTQAELDRSAFLGAIFEGWIASEVVKKQVNAGGRKEIYHFRDQQGLEVDFLFPSAGGKLWAIECKAAKTIYPAMAGSLKSLRSVMPQTASVHLSIVHRPARTPPEVRALAPGVDTLDTYDFIKALAD